MASSTPTSLWEGIDIPIIGVTGPKFSGKTVFASTVDPQNTLMIDAEMSSASYAGIPYKKRIDLFEVLAAKKITAPTPMDAFVAWKETCDAVKPGEYSVVVTDPWDFIQSGLHDWIESHPELFKRSAGQYAKMSAMVWGDLKSWLHMYLSMLAKKLTLPNMKGSGSNILICHEGDEWKGSSPTGKKKTRGVDTVYQLASLFLNMERKPDQKGRIPQVPSAYACESHRGKSRLMHTEFVDGELLSKPILPARIPVCTPKEIREYIKKPADLSKPKSGEAAPEEVFTEEQKLQLQLEISRNQAEASNAELAKMELLKQAAERNAARTMTIVTSPPDGGATATITGVTISGTTISDTIAKDEQQPSPQSDPQPVATSSTKSTEEPKGVAQEAEETSKQQDAAGASDAPFDPNTLDVHKVIHEQHKILVEEIGFKDDVFWTVIAKRLQRNGEPCRKIEDLNKEQAEELRKAFWELIEKKLPGRKSRQG